MTKRLSITEKQNRALERIASKSQRDLFCPPAVQVPSTVQPLDQHVPEEATTESWGALSGAVYERAKACESVLDESPVPSSPYAQPYFSVIEYHWYKNNDNTIERSLFLLLVAFSLKSDGL